MSAMPPPLPWLRGEFIIEKEGGTTELITLDGVSGWNQVSVRAKRSMELSAMNSWSRQGLSRVWVIEVADLMLRQEKISGPLKTTGPGLHSTLPESRSKRRIRNRVLGLLGSERIVPGPMWCRKDNKNE